MTRRLQALADLIPDGKGVVDVGTDHGYIPLILAKRGYCGNIIASDINEGPLQAARRTMAESGYDKKVRFLLCDGLDLCDPEAIDTIVIAGMGGDTICGILDRAEWCLDSAYSLILQPMTKPEVVRYWLIYNGFELTDEKLVKENGTIYQIICASYGGETKCSDGELFIGSVSKLRDDPLFYENLTEYLKRTETSICGIKSGVSQTDGVQLRLLTEIHRDLLRIKDAFDADRKLS